MITVLSSEFKTNIPKNMSILIPVTLEIICSFLREHKSEKLSIEDIAKNVSLSRVTLRRYMNYLIDKNSVIGGVDYSTGGRPSAVYTYIGK